MGRRNALLWAAAVTVFLLAPDEGTLSGAVYVVVFAVPLVVGATMTRLCAVGAFVLIYLLVTAVAFIVCLGFDRGSAENIGGLLYFGSPLVALFVLLGFVLRILLRKLLWHHPRQMPK